MCCFQVRRSKTEYVFSLTIKYSQYGNNLGENYRKTFDS